MRVEKILNHNLIKSDDQYFKTIYMCPKFEIEADIIPTQEAKQTQNQRARLRFPYPVTYFELIGKNVFNLSMLIASGSELDNFCECCYGKLEQNDIVFDIFILPSQNYPALIGRKTPGLFIYKNKKHSIYRKNPINDGTMAWKFVKEIFNMPVEKFIDSFLSTIYNILEIINCRNIVIQNNKPPEKLNKKRQERGKLPLFEYKTLHIITDEKKYKYLSVEDQEKQKRNSPRLHTRRGHIRQYLKHNIWIDPTIIGTNKKGIILKDYHVSKSI